MKIEQSCQIFEVVLSNRENNEIDLDNSVIYLKNEWNVFKNRNS